MKNNGSIAILGGMGPQASTKLLEVIFGMCVKDFGAKDDSDFPEVILNSIPVPNFISSKQNTKTVLKILTKRVIKLEAFNPACFGIACNTAHVLLKDLRSNTAIPFVSIVDEVATKVSESKIDIVGLLATPVTIKSCLYKNALEKKKIRLVLPSKTNQIIVEQVIRKILAGRAGDKERQLLVAAARSLEKQGAQGIILGCTELPLIFPKDFSIPVFDSIEILARGLLRKFFERK